VYWLYEILIGVGVPMAIIGQEDALWVVLDTFNWTIKIFNIRTFMH